MPTDMDLLKIYFKLTGKKSLVTVSLTAESDDVIQLGVWRVF